MAHRCRRSLLGIVLVAATVLLQAQPARAAAIAFSSITAVLTVTPAAGTLQFDTFEASASAKAQNSLGELDDQFDFMFGAPASIDAAVTWADAHGEAGDQQAAANSSVNLPGIGPSAARSVGQGEWFNTFTITGGTGTVSVDFLVDVGGALNLFTDTFGEVARGEVILNLLLDGETIAFGHRLHTIGRNDAFSDVFAVTLAASLDLEYDTTYTLLMRADSESEAINAVPEPSTVALLAVGLGAACRSVRRGRTLSSRR